MADFDFNKLKGLDMTGFAFNFSNSVQNIADRISSDKETIRAIEFARRAKETEELRRHNELVEALKEAGEKGATIIVGDNANQIQIQQNSAGSIQTINNSEGLDYEKAMLVLKEINSYFDYPQFKKTYGSNSENIKKMVEDTMIAVENKEDERLIKKSLHLLKNLTEGAAGSLIASGILALLGTLLNG